MTRTPEQYVERLEEKRDVAVEQARASALRLRGELDSAIAALDAAVCGVYRSSDLDLGASTFGAATKDLREASIWLQEAAVARRVLLGDGA